VRRPPITITCECGRAERVPYGDRWACPGCGKRWNTSQIPAAEYDELLRRLRRYRAEVLVFAAAGLAVFVPLIVLVDTSYMYLAAVVGFAYVFLYAPFWRRRIRRVARDAPRWKLRPE